MFLPGEQVLFHSSVHYRTRHGFFPAKRRVLALTVLPRLTCIKEYTERQTSSSSSATAHYHNPGDIAVKSELLFSLTTSTTRPPALSKISEGSDGPHPHPHHHHHVSGGAGDAGAVGEEEVQQDSSTEEAAVAPAVAPSSVTPAMPAPKRRSSFVLGSSTPRPAVVIVKGVEGKGDKTFVIRSVSRLP